LVSEVAPRGFRESWKGGRSSRGLTTQSSAADDRDGLCLQDQCPGWEPRERSAPPPPPPLTTTAATMAASTSPAPTPMVGLVRWWLPLLNLFVPLVNVFFQCACWTCDGLVDPLLICSTCVYVELVMN
jgi:hypothetical protein